MKLRLLYGWCTGGLRDKSGTSAWEVRKGGDGNNPALPPGQDCFQLYLLIKNRPNPYAAAIEEIMLGVAQSAFFVAQELQGKVMKQMQSGSAIAFLPSTVLCY